MSANLNALRGSAAIAGVATFGCGEAPGFTDMELLVRSARAAVADAGLKMSDIDGLCTASVAASAYQPRTSPKPETGCPDVVAWGSVGAGSVAGAALEVSFTMTRIVGRPPRQPRRVSPTAPR